MVIVSLILSSSIPSCLQNINKFKQVLLSSLYSNNRLIKMGKSCKTSDDVFNTLTKSMSDNDNVHKLVLRNYLKLWLKDNDYDNPDNAFNFASGKLFEYYVVSLIDAKKWKLISWRGDKFQKLYRNRYKSQKEKEDIKKGRSPESNSYPDIILEYIGEKSKTGFTKGDRIAIECKWTGHQKETTEAIAKNRFEDVEDRRKKRMEGGKENYASSALKESACCLYYAIGVGWQEKRSHIHPEAVYLIPAGTKIDAETEIDVMEPFLLKKEKLNFRKEDALIFGLVHNDEIETRIGHLRNYLETLEKELNKRK